MRLFYRTHGKRLFDLMVAIPLTLVAAPILLAVAALVWWRLGRPVLFTQLRPGLSGRAFRLYKFRTMTDARDSAGRLLPDAERLSRFGRWLRSTSLDELPELWNVVRGEMSLAGPRPLLMEYLERYTPQQARRHEVTPGLTGLAQVSGRNRLPWSSRLALDTWYVDRCGMWIDVAILLKTAYVLVTRRGINAEGHATAPEFQGTRRSPPRNQWDDPNDVDVDSLAGSRRHAAASLLPAGIVWPAETCYKSRPANSPSKTEIHAMDANQFLQTLDEAFQLPSGTTRMDDALRDIAEFSSLIVLVLIAAIDEKFEVTVAPEDLAACRTVADLAELVSSESLLLKKSA